MKIKKIELENSRFINMFSVIVSYLKIGFRKFYILVYL